MKKVNVMKLVELFEFKVFVGDFNKGSGVYGVYIGSRGEVEDVVFIGGEDYEVRSKEKLIEDCVVGVYEDDREYYEEFCESGVIDWYGDVEGKYENLSDEEGIEYFNVEV